MARNNRIWQKTLWAFLVIVFFRWYRSGPAKSQNLYPDITRGLVIASTTSSNLTWLDPALQVSHWEPYIYVTDSHGSKKGGKIDNRKLSVPANKGNEAMVYLTWIIDHYDDLPDVVFFHHHHGQAWHQQFSSRYELENLNVANVLKHGYVSPRCLPGCENVIELSGDVAPLSDLKSASRELLISSVLHAFWRDENGSRIEIPRKIAAPCCAQFAVSKERILKGYEGDVVGIEGVSFPSCFGTTRIEDADENHRWLIDTEISSASAERVLEYTWHLWFGMEPEFCPEEKTCLCDVYGVGDRKNSEL